MVSVYGIQTGVLVAWTAAVYSGVRGGGGALLMCFGADSSEDVAVLVVGCGSAAKPGAALMPSLHRTARLLPAPPCSFLQDDLLCLPAKLAASLGNIGPVVVVTRVTNAITLTDPLTLRQAVLEANAFWRTPLRPIMTSRQLSEFYILDAEVVEPTGECGCSRAVFLCVSRCQRVCVLARTVLALCSMCACACLLVHRARRHQGHKLAQALCWLANCSQLIKPYVFSTPLWQVCTATAVGMRWRAAR